MLDSPRETADFVAGWCTSRAVCDEMRRLEPGNGQCFYADGALYRGGPLARGGCEESERGLLCGPGCGGCPEGYECFGPSEAHGLGLCARQGLPDSPSLCAPTSPICPEGKACLRLRTAPGSPIEVAPSLRAGICVGPRRCREVAARHPDRFECDTTR